MGKECTRRQFVVSSIAAAGFPALGSLAAGEQPAAEKPPRNPFFALCMDTHDAKKRTLREQAEMLKELGYDGAGHLWLDGLEERVKTLDAAGLKLFQVYFRASVAPGEAPYDARLKDALPLLKGRGTMLGVLVSGGKSSDPAAEARAIAAVGEIADLARKHEVRVSLYPHVGDFLERVEDALRLEGKLARENVGVMFNLCHWMKVDEEKNLGKVLAAARARLLAVTINGCDRPDEVRSGKGKWIVPLDEGDFDMAGFLRSLRATGWRGPIGLQCYGIGGDAREHLARSMAAWRKLEEGTEGGRR